MDNSLKQRIIGAVVLIALAIIFLPSILKDKVVKGTFESKIPAKPEELQTYKIDTKKIDDLIAENKKNQESQEVDGSTQSKVNTKQTSLLNEQKETSSSSNVAEAKEQIKTKVLSSTEKVAQSSATGKKDAKTVKSKISEDYKDAAWIIQVASFAKQTNAVNLVKKLQNKKYKSYRRKVTADGKVVHRVFVGPYIHKKDASKVLKKISQLSESSALIKPFDPVEH